MGFELYTRKKSHGGPPAVTVTKYGNFVVNGSAIEKYFKNIQYLHVYWDKDSGKVGLKPLPKKQDKSYHLHLSPRGNVGTVSATSFLKFVGYDHKETTSFPVTWNDTDELVEFTIMEGKKPKRFPRD
jgi:hypothetical protein